MIIKWFLLFFTLNRIVSAINADSILTPEENNVRKEKCGTFPPPSLSGRSITNSVTWFYKFKPKSYGHLVAAISQKHMAGRSFDVLLYSPSKHYWAHNESAVFDRETHCKSGKKFALIITDFQLNQPTFRYLEIPAGAIALFRSSYGFTVKQGYILGICDKFTYHYPMILEISATFEAFACIADERATITMNTEVYTYDDGYNPFRLNIVSINDSLIVLNTDKKGNFGGPVVIVVGGRVTLFGTTTFSAKGVVWFSVERIDESLCTLFRICNKKYPETTTIGDQFTSTSTTEPTTTTKTTTTTMTTEPTTITTTTTTKTTTMTTEPVTTTTTTQPTTTTTSERSTSRMDNYTVFLTTDTETGKIFLISGDADYKYEEYIDEEYEAFLVENRDWWKSKNGSGRKEILSVELCALTLIVLRFIY